MHKIRFLNGHFYILVLIISMLGVIKHGPEKFTGLILTERKVVLRS